MAGYEASGQTRKEYCQAVGLAVTTLDYYRARQSRREHERERGKRKPSLVRVKLVPKVESQGMPMQLEAGGRRLQWVWDGSEEHLAVVLRAMERA